MPKKTRKALFFKGRGGAKTGALKLNPQNRARTQKRIQQQVARNVIVHSALNTIKPSTTDIVKVREFRRSINSWPIYIISAHGCICPNEGPCVEIERSRDHSNTFKIPKDTIIMSFTQGGDMCMSLEEGTTIEDNIIQHADEIRPFCMMHSSSDVVSPPEEENPSFFGRMKRATSGSEYPNMLLQFQETDEDMVNTMGVYNLNTLPKKIKGVLLRNKVHSIIKEGEAPKNIHFLKDVIRTVYERSGSSKGIFIISACMVQCHPTLESRDTNAMEIAQNVIAIANAEYTARIPTVTGEEATHHMIERPFNYGLTVHATMISPPEVVSLVLNRLLAVNKIRKTFDKTELSDAEYKIVISMLIDECKEEIKKIQTQLSEELDDSENKRRLERNKESLKKSLTYLKGEKTKLNENENE